MADKEKFVVKQLIVEDLQFKLVAVSVTAAASSGASAADPELVNGTIMGIVPSGNQDQFVDNVAVTAASGVVTVTLAAAATADNTFNVTVWRDDDSYF